MTERKLATIEKIQSLTPIEGADRIELAHIRGWDVVVQKGIYEVGDGVVYFEIDSMVDVTKPQFTFLADRGVRTDFEGRTGHVVKTMRLRGQYSQGLAIPWKEFGDELSHLYDRRFGTDVTDMIGVWKWEPPIPASLSGKMRGGMPGWVRKTDAERIQNFEDYLPLNPDEFYCTEKIDGSSATFTLHGDDFHVCSRNIDLYETEGNTFWEIANRYNIKDVLTAWLADTPGATACTIQGEVYGEGVNGNRLGLKGHHFAAFNFEIDGSVQNLDHLEETLPLVPWLDVKAPQTVAEALEAVDGMKSTLSKDRLAEGVVWRRKDGEDIIPGVRTVKAISNKYLLKSE
jgi:RNA ligase (TIGR02306 family)